MSPLTLDLFAQAAYDAEAAQYKLLARLQDMQRAFKETRIYPHFGELLHCFQTVRLVVQQSEDVRQALPKRMKRIDLKEGAIEYERAAWFDGSQLEAVEAMMQWALPRLRHAVEEGQTICEFVEAQLHMEEIGIMPAYTQEGYLLVHNAETDVVDVLRYTLSSITGSDGKYRTLRTMPIKRLPFGGVHEAPGAVKLALVAEHPDLPNPATFFFDAAVDFPYEPTMLPIVKRKMLRYLGTPGVA